MRDQGTRELLKDTGLRKAMLQPTVEVTLNFTGREIRSEAELERLLEELRRRVLHELSANHRVRLK